MAQKTIDALAAEGILCTPAEILWLHSMAEPLTRRSRCDNAAWLDLPIVCGNVTLYDLSIGAKEWLRERFEWFAADDDLFQLAEAFAMANARQPGKLLALTSRVKTTWEIIRWSRALTCSRSELSRAMDALLDGQEYIDLKTPKEEREEKVGAPLAAPSDYGDALAKLMHYYPGRPLSYWLWELPEKAVAALIDNISQFLPIEQRLNKDSQAVQEAGKYRLVVKHIREAHKPQKEDPVAGHKSQVEGHGGAPSATPQK